MFEKPLYQWSGSCWFPAILKRHPAANRLIVKVMDLREVVQSGNIEMVEACFNKHTNVRQELMAQNAVNGAGLLMLSVTTGNVSMLKRIASEIKTRVSVFLGLDEERYWGQVKWKHGFGVVLMCWARRLK